MNDDVPDLADLTARMHREQALRQSFMDSKIQEWCYAVLKRRIHRRRFRVAFRAGTPDDIIRLQHYLEQAGIEIRHTEMVIRPGPDGLTQYQQGVAVLQHGCPIARQIFTFLFQGYA